jgi:hypothetical protein
MQVGQYFVITGSFEKECVKNVNRIWELFDCIYALNIFHIFKYLKKYLNIIKRHVTWYQGQAKKNKD